MHTRTNNHLSISPQWLIAVVLIIVALLAAACGDKPVSLPSATAVESAVGTADQKVNALAGKALGALLAGSKLVNVISQNEDRGAREGVIPPNVDAQFDKLMIAYVNNSDRAVAGIQAGVKSWEELQALVNPVLADVQRLYDLGNSAQSLRVRLGEWLAALRDGFATALGDQAFGSAINGVR